MNSKCEFCMNEFPKISKVLDSVVCFSDWKPIYENFDVIQFRKPKMSTCIPCGKGYYEWKISNQSSKLSKLKNRSLTGKFKPTKFPKYDISDYNDICVFCRNETNQKIKTPVDYRINYVIGVGQFCNNCYPTLMI